MAASSLCRDFRKINIEQYEDDFYEDDAPQSEPVQPQMNEVQMLISSGKGQVNIDYMTHIMITLTHNIWSLIIMSHIWIILNRQ